VQSSIIKEWYAIQEGKDSHIDRQEWENLHRHISEVTAEMQAIVGYWKRK